MRLRYLAIAAGVVVIALAGVAQIGRDNGEPVTATPATGAPAMFTTLAARGEYLARAADCLGCHVTGGGKPYAGGRSFDLPFGRIYSTNITPDPETGIGRFTEQQFVDAVQHGKAPRGNLYPAMPYAAYASMSREDVLAIRAYLETVEPVKTTVPANELPFPFNQRWGLAVWKRIFASTAPARYDGQKTLLWNRGAYLAGALGHCAECHTPRNVGFGLKSSESLSGETLLGQRAYNITPDAAHGIDSWTNTQLEKYLSTGHADGHGSATGPMAEVINYSLRHLTPGDISALVAYLREGQAKTGANPITVSIEPSLARSSGAVYAADAGLAHARGLQVFANQCAGCHQFDGTGRGSPFATLLGAKTVNDTAGTNLVKVILEGSSLQTAHGAERMPGFGMSLDDGDIAAVSNYVLAQMGDKSGVVSAQDVARARTGQ
ncbi:cytochrome c [Paraburkholderia sp. LEh10]|uniref:c-type cytochrome n=1 Tax=Paraburkholderia sp. LEh10 TaxID=2821353 RepID=UPI001AE8691F|nr:cytochrome c [Paraburkholderia sp. LEh10]MBP0590413.1 cytochrome c [Paraburkholderia sp. LEh10]